MSHTLTTPEPSGLIRLQGARHHADADLPTEWEGRRVPPLSKLRSLLRDARDMALDGCALPDQGTECAHGEASWLATLDLL